MGINDDIIWDMSLPGVGTGHAFRIDSKQDGHYYVDSEGKLYREVSGSYEHMQNFSGDITFRDKHTSLFKANFKNGTARLIWFT